MTFRACEQQSVQQNSVERPASAGKPAFDQHCKHRSVYFGGGGQGERDGKIALRPALGSIHTYACCFWAFLQCFPRFQTCFWCVFLMCVFFFLPNFLLGRLNNAKTHHEATTCLSAASSLKSIVPKKQCFAFKKSLTISKNRGTKMHWCVP